MMINGNDTLPQSWGAKGTRGDSGQLDGHARLGTGTAPEDSDDCCQTRIWARAPRTSTTFRKKPGILIFENAWILTTIQNNKRIHGTENKQTKLQANPNSRVQLNPASCDFCFLRCILY